MKKFGKTVARTLPALLFAMLARPALATDSEPGRPTFFLDISGGYSIFKSELVQSNDTGITARYAFGVNGGADHQVGMLFARESSTIAFKNTASSVALSWQDVDLRYRLGPLYFGLVVSSSTWTVKSPARVAGKIDETLTSEEYIDLTASGYGGNVGLQLPVGKRNLLYADLTYVTIGAVQQKAAGANGSAAALAAAERVTTIGPRMELDLGAAIALTRNLVDATVGFKYRTYSVSVDSAASKELLNTTYAGLRLNWLF